MKGFIKSQVIHTDNNGVFVCLKHMINCLQSTVSRFRRYCTYMNLVKNNLQSIVFSSGCLMHDINGLGELTKRQDVFRFS